VRHGHLSEREIMTGIGPVVVCCSRVRNRGAADGGKRMDRDALLAFYDFPTEHWKHLRMTSPIESTFATVRHRTVRSRGCLSNKIAIAMIFKLAQAVEKSWRRLKGHAQLPKVIRGVMYNHGVEVVRSQAQTAAA
jgi:hypothetical protein